MSDDATTEKIKKLPFITIWIAQLIVLYVGGFYVIAWYSKLISGKGLLWIFLGLLVIEEGLRHLKKKYPQEFQKMIFSSKPIVLPEKPIRLRVVGMAVLFVIFFLSLIWYLFLIAIRILPTPYAIIGFIIVSILGTFWYLLKKKYPNEYKSMSLKTMGT